MKAVSKMLRITLPFVLAAASWATPAAAQSSYDGAPTPTFLGGDVVVRAPQAEGWRMQGVHGNAVAFAYHDTASTTDVVAVGRRSGRTATSSFSDFLTQIQAQAERSNMRLVRVLSSRYATTHERGYRCSRSSIVAEQASLEAEIDDEHPPVRVHAHSMACRRDGENPHGLFAFFQYRSPEPSKDLDAASESFFEGVQFVQD